MFVLALWKKKHLLNRYFFALTFSDIHTSACVNTRINHVFPFLQYREEIYLHKPV